MAETTPVARSFAPEMRSGHDCGRVLFVQFTAEPSGSPLSGLLIAEALRQRGTAVDVVFGRPGACAAQYEGIGCGVHHLRHGNWLTANRWFRQARTWPRELAVARDFTKLMRTSRPDLVYINNATGAAAAIAARWLNIPFVWHLRELFDDVGGEIRVPPVGGKAIARRLLQLADHIVAVSDAVRRNVVGESSRIPVSVVPNAAFARFFNERRTPAECRDLLGLTRHGLLIGVPGTLRPMKGHTFLLDAAKQVHARFPECHFAITGTGPADYRAALEHFIVDAGLRNNVHFLGTVHDMAAFYRACDVICVPSRSDPCPRAAIEPLAIGTPVIGSDVGGISETIDHGRTGLLVPCADVNALTQQMVRLLSDAGLRASMATAAQSKALTHYREDMYQDRVLAIIDSVLERRHAHA
jgi:glycosyltransferase involved in cell wall biosynthesis